MFLGEQRATGPRAAKESDLKRDHFESVVLTITMTENSTCTERDNRAKSLKFYLCASFLCITMSAVLLMFVFILYAENCLGCRTYVVGILSSLAIVLFIAGLLILSTTVCGKRRHSNVTPQVVISFIPAEDLEKSPVSFLSYNQFPRGKPFADTSSIDLPDYFTVVQNVHEFYSSVDENVWTEDVPETPPPCYEQAIEMKSFQHSK